MNCGYCGYLNEEATRLCLRCGADIPEPACTECEVVVAWGETICPGCREVKEGLDQTPCPCCGSLKLQRCELQLKEESSERAEALYREAIAILEEVGNEAQLARCLSNHGHFLLELGHLVRGKKKLEMAGEIFKRLEMRKLWDATEALIRDV